jgi:hypothetical protein
MPTFKLKKFLIEEGKDKILKKLKESLSKNNLTYNEEIFSVLIPYESKT